MQTWASVQASACAGRSLNCRFNGWIKLTLISPNWPLSMNINCTFSFPKIIHLRSNREWQISHQQVESLLIDTNWNLLVISQHKILQIEENNFDLNRYYCNINWTKSMQRFWKREKQQTSNLDAFHHTILFDSRFAGRNTSDCNISIILLENPPHFENVDTSLLREYCIQLEQKKKKRFSPLNLMMEREDKSHLLWMEFVLNDNKHDYHDCDWEFLVVDWKKKFHSFEIFLENNNCSFRDFLSLLVSMNIYFDSFFHIEIQLMEMNNYSKSDLLEKHFQDRLTDTTTIPFFSHSIRTMKIQCLHEIEQQQLFPVLFQVLC